mgnify:CR=1
MWLKSRVHRLSISFNPRPYVRGDAELDPDDYPTWKVSIRAPT